MKKGVWRILIANYAAWKYAKKRHTNPKYTDTQQIVPKRAKIRVVDEVYNEMAAEIIRQQNQAKYKEMKTAITLVKITADTFWFIQSCL